MDAEGVGLRASVTKGCGPHGCSHSTQVYFLGNRIDKRGSGTELPMIRISEMGYGCGCVAEHENALSVNECELMPGSRNKKKKN